MSALPPSAPLGRLRLGVNIDHVATVRNARGGEAPDPIRAAELAQASGADGIIAPLREAGCRVSIFIAADQRQIDAAHRIGAAVIELHTGAYCDAHAEGRIADRDAELERLRAMSTYAHGLGLEVHAGHGLTYDTVQPVAAFPEVMELNIGHFLIGEAIFRGLEPAIAEMRRLMDDARP